jgi:hypothetical protein
MTLTVLRRWPAVIASLGALALVAACSGTSPSSSLSLTGPSGTLRSSSGEFSPNPTTIPDPCVDASPAGADFRTNPGGDPPPPVLCDGRFTGGGFQINANEVKVTRGFTLHCDGVLNGLSNNFEVNWKDANGNAHHFHTDKNPAVTECSKPVIPNPPTADVSRIVIIDQPGKLDGENDPTHLITIVLEDWGEPGTADRAYIAITGIPALTFGTVAAPALIDGGNIQAHLDQPHKN